MITTLNEYTEFLTSHFNLRDGLWYRIGSFTETVNPIRIPLEFLKYKLEGDK